jgi:FtsZ-interacting cell division protein YlmF
MVNAASSTTKNDTGTRNNKYTSSKSTGKNSRSYTNREERTGYNSSRRDSSEISIYNVKNFEDATLVCDKLVSGLPIIVSFDDPNSPNSQRVMDFIAGCIYTLNGSLHTVSDRIFLFSPEGVDVSGDYINMVKENSFGVPTFNKMI